jgi:methionyl aminopeptidase
MVQIKSPREIELMRKVGKMAAECLDFLQPMMKPGVTALQVDKVCHDWTVERGAVPAPLNYHGFPSSLCISVNDVVCHGIPDKRAFREGDIVNLDVTPKLEGYHGDTNWTFCIGKVKPEVQKLVDVAYQSLWDGIREVRPGATLGDIGYAIQQTVEKAGYSVVRDYCGHGIGREFHEEPEVRHFGRQGEGLKLRAGMIFTIEPMVNMGKYPVYVEDDGWTVRTCDRLLSAQFEHTILVTETGYEVLTLRTNENPLSSR